jgi:hypothetical protein
MKNLIDLNPNSKLWLYASDRKLSQTEIEWLNENLKKFAKDWSSHGSSLEASASVINPYFIAFAVDLSKENASGCSIDKSVKLVKELGQELNIDFFNRLKVWIENDSDEIISINYSKLNEHIDKIMYNPMIEKVGDLATKFRIPVNKFLEIKQLI